MPYTVRVLPHGRYTGHTDSLAHAMAAAAELAAAWGCTVQVHHLGDREPCHVATPKALEA